MASPSLNCKIIKIIYIILVAHIAEDFKSVQTNSCKLPDHARQERPVVTDGWWVGEHRYSPDPLHFGHCLGHLELELRHVARHQVSVECLLDGAGKTFSNQDPGDMGASHRASGNGQHFLIGDAPPLLMDESGIDPVRLSSVPAHPW